MSQNSTSKMEIETNDCQFELAALGLFGSSLTSLHDPILMKCWCSVLFYMYYTEITLFFQRIGS